MSLSALHIATVASPLQCCLKVKFLITVIKNDRMIKISRNRKTYVSRRHLVSVSCPSLLMARERNITCLCQQLSLMLWFEQKMLNCFEQHYFPSHCITFVRSGQEMNEGWI